MLTRLRLWWSLRNTPVSQIKDLNELLTMTGRRVTYDNVHLLSTLTAINSYLRQIQPSVAEGFDLEIATFSERSTNWMAIFNPADGGKSYYSRIHRHARELEKEIERLETLCRKHDIDPVDPNKIPF